MIHTIKVKLDEGSYIPERSHYNDAGMDLRSPRAFIIYPNDKTDIDTGVHMEIPDGYVGLLCSKSGLFFKNDIFVEGVIDSGYRGSVHVCMRNLSADMVYTGHPGDKIAQILLMPVELVTPIEVDELEEGIRGDKGFGSTGR